MLIYFLWSHRQIVKLTYFNTAFHSDQRILDSLSVARHVLEQFHIDYIDAVELYAICDSVGSYHENCYTESIYRISKEKNTPIKRLEFNKPQKGEDQCDRDIALARNALRSYVDEGNDILGEDIYQALVKLKIRNVSISYFFW